MFFERFWRLRCPVFELYIKFSCGLNFVVSAACGKKISKQMGNHARDARVDIITTLSTLATCVSCAICGYVFFKNVFCQNLPLAFSTSAMHFQLNFFVSCVFIFNLSRNSCHWKKAWWSVVTLAIRYWLMVWCLFVVLSFLQCFTVLHSGYIIHHVNTVYVC